MIRNTTRDRLLRFLGQKANEKKSHIAIFDIGTKACRILIAPKKLPEGKEWNNITFFNDGDRFFLGEDVNPDFKSIDIRTSRALSKVIEYINWFKRMITDNDFVLQDNIHLVGTEVFRWLENPREVIDHVKERTGLEIIILNKKEESLLSLCSIIHTYSYDNNQARLQKHEKFTENDVILLFDQGGGSTEISYFFPQNPGKYSYDSIGRLGTVALQTDFFALGEKGGRNINPRLHTGGISQQLDRLNAWIDGMIAQWPGFKEIEGRNLIAYGMGTALGNAFSNGNGFSKHNKKLTSDELHDRVVRLVQKIGERYRDIGELYREFKRDIVKQLRSDLTLLNGLPVYNKLLRKFQVDSIRFAGFGLRYGVYIYMYSSERNSLPEIEIPAIPIQAEQPQAVPVSSKRFRVGLSFAGEKRNYVSGVAKYLAEKLGKDQVLYDEYHRAEFSRPGLDHYLPSKYKTETELIVVFYCQDYKRKEWTQKELETILELEREDQSNRIMFVQFDNLVSADFNGAGAQNSWDFTPRKLAEEIISRLNFENSVDSM